MTATLNDELADLRRENAELRDRLRGQTAELNEARQQQSATAEIVQVINSSLGDVLPVFDAILEKAHTLCGADRGTLFLFDGEAFRAVAAHGYPEDLATLLRRPRKLSEAAVFAPLLSGARLIHHPDLTQIDDPTARAVAERGGVRTNLLLPLRKDGALLGLISCNRFEVRPFTEQQILILENFASQAVIAIENARLINDTQETLEQQTATAEVLKAISRSTFDLQTILDTLVESATRLCGADHAWLFQRDGEIFRWVASFGHVSETHNRIRDYFRPHEVPVDMGSVTGRAALESRVVHVPDVLADPEYTWGEAQQIGGYRTALGVPLFNKVNVVGVIFLGRTVPQPFSSKQIELATTFADQAVIAMENARLITELHARTNDLQESLEYQTATSDVLKVISGSTFDLAPALDSVVNTAMRLCGADHAAIYRNIDGEYHWAAGQAQPAEYEQIERQVRILPGSETLVGRAALQKQTVHILDCQTDPLYEPKEDARSGGIHTLLGVPLLRDGETIGVIGLARQRVERFTGRQIELVRTFADQAVIAIENARLITETRQALEQQTATAEVLGVINSSPGDLAPVFHAMLEKATRLCGADFGIFFTFDGEVFHTPALRGATAAYAQFLNSNPLRPSANNMHSRMMAGEPFVQISDAMAVSGYADGDPMVRAFVDLGEGRTVLAVALRKEGLFLGELAVYRREVRPFSDQEIGLLRNFAAQAVIAMENARLITETREALEQQTATAEVLKVINSSPGDLAPVFDSILEKAHNLCGVAFGTLQQFDGERFHAVAVRGVPEGLADLLREPIKPLPGAPTARLLAGERVVQIADLSEAARQRPDDPWARATADHGLKVALFIPLRTQTTLLGYIAAFRGEAQSFSEIEISLLENFAAQAVVAIENARLITETREALDQQTATAEVLAVISSSPGNLAPVFETMLERAMRLCEAAFGVLWMFEEDRLCPTAWRGVPPKFAEFLSKTQTVPGPGTAAYRFLRGGERSAIHVLDMAEEEVYRTRDALRVALVDLGRARTALHVPLRREDAVLGVITLYRQEVRLFSEKQVGLLQNFASQAVIAMENARLITETREALEQQTATAEILRVISNSPTDVQPTFDAIVASAANLCEAEFSAVARFDGGLLHLVATNNLSAKESAAFHSLFPRPALTNFAMGRAFVEARPIHFDDVLAEADYDDRTRQVLQTASGYRTFMAVPILRSGMPIGVIGCARRRVQPFTTTQIDLLNTFAEQAAIALDNVRLFNELSARNRDLTEALEYQTATSDVLQVISRSTFDLQPVLDTLTETAARLCAAELGFMTRRDGDAYRFVTAVGSTPATTADAIRIKEIVLDRHSFVAGRESITGRVISEADTVQIVDLASDPEYTLNDLITVGKIHTLLGVPLLREGAVIGTMSLGRQRVEPFTQRQIELVRTFADQAVIAIENARLLTETREALEQQTATAEILGVISSSPTDVQPTFNAIAARANVLCNATSDGVFRFDGSRIYLVAHNGWTVAEFEAIRDTFPLVPGRGSVTARAILSKQVAHVHDISKDPEYAATAIAQSGLRSVLSVPMLRDGEPIGAITVDRREVRPFSETEIGLLKTFADQAVIAIENVRLFDELRRRQAELRVTFDNMGDGVVMFDEHRRLAAWNRNFQELLDLTDAVLGQRPSYTEYLHILADRGEFGGEDIEAELNRRLEHADQEFRTERTRPNGRVIEVRRNAVPDGGFVLIYSDITERKRSEAEIRAARDAAEAAYRDLKAAQANLIQAEKMASLGQLTAGIAHEIKNPLNFVNNFAGLSVELLDELKETAAPALDTLAHQDRADVDETIEMLTSNLEKIAEHGKRADNIVKSMLEHSRGVTGERRSVDLNNLVDEALNLAYHGARAQDQSFNITLERDFGQGIAPIELVPQDITRVCLNLFGNGFYAARKRQEHSGGPKFAPVLKVSTRDLGDAIEIRTRDNGIGILPEIRDKLFQPFFTTKPTGEGTGLGLSISYDIITQEHGGTIEVDSEVGKFTEFTIRLPRSFHGATTGAAA